MHLFLLFECQWWPLTQPEFSPTPNVELHWLLKLPLETFVWFVSFLYKKKKCLSTWLIAFWLFHRVLYTFDVFLCRISFLSFFVLQAGHASRSTQDDENMIKLLQEELGKDSFTHVIISGIKPEHIHYLGEDFDRWCSQLVWVQSNSIGN